MKDHEVDPEIKEMWDTIAGNISEDEQEGVRTLDDYNFIDDTGVDPSDCHRSCNEHSPSRAPKVEEDDEIKELFKIGKKKKKKKNKKKNEKSCAEMALLVENVMAELEVVAEEDRGAITKLKKLSLETDVVFKFSYYLFKFFTILIRCWF